MAKWFRDLPINLRNGTDRTRSASESDSLPRCRYGPQGGGSCRSASGSLLSGRNGKHSAAELGRGAGGTSGKETKVWDNFMTGKARKTAHEDQRNPKTYSRLIKVEAQEKSQMGQGPERVKGHSKSEQVIILEDYSDPFDAQKTKQQREAERVGDNDGYVEPYDAQQMITEIRRRGSKDLLKINVPLEGGEGASEDSWPSPPQIYDTPYEEGLEEGDGMRIHLSRPEQDLRPATEYELPWEWRKEQIVRTLSAQFENKEEPPQPDHQQHLRQKSWSQKVLKAFPTSHLLDTDSARVDPTIPLDKQSWYHGCVTRQEAEARLQVCKEASFLVRTSESGTSKYSIALKTSQGCVHIIVAQTKGSSYTLDQSSCVFASIAQVVHHYCTQQLPFMGAEHMTLLYPVPRPH